MLQLSQAALSPSSCLGLVQHAIRLSIQLLISTLRSGADTNAHTALNLQRLPLPLNLLQLPQVVLFSSPVMGSSRANFCNLALSSTIFFCCFSMTAAWWAWARETAKPPQRR